MDILNSILLVTHIEMFEFLRSWLPVGFSIGSFFYMLYRNNSKELENKLKAERQKTDDRLAEIEKIQVKNVPKFLEICDEVKHLSEQVNSKHELRFTGIVADIARLRDNYDQRFANNEKMVDGVMKKIDKLEEKIDKSFDKIMDEIVKLNSNK